EQRANLKKLTEDLAKRLEAIPGVYVEDKGLTASVHYRVVPPERQEEVRRLVHGAMASASPPLQLSAGDRVFDIRPRTYWSKGDAVKWTREHVPLTGALVIYIGDDATDEEAFAALPADITIRVGTAPETLAQYHLEDVAQVRAFLTWL